MCGIFGSIGYGSYEAKSINRIKESLNHRGPDSFETFEDQRSSLFLAHTRLSIIDLSPSGNQPMIDPKSGNIIVFNGEIYNFREIRAELIKLGANFRGTSDTEVLLQGYRFFGKKILKHLVGMFAFAIWDSSQKHLFIARDRLGEKPLYYSHTNNGKFIFGSELTSLLVDNNLSRNINKNVLLHFIRFGYTPSKESILKGINKLEPATYIVVNDKEILEKVEYWKLSKFFLHKQEYSSTEEAIDKCDSLLKTVISSQLMADVPVGVFLSGGVDSGVVAGIAKKTFDNVLTFSAGFKEPAFDERSQSASISKIISTDHNSFSLGSPGFNDILLPYKSCDEPFGDTSSIPTYYLSKITRGKVKVCLSGDGGDEIFCGYSTYLADKAYMLSKFIPRKVFAGASVLSDYIPSQHGKVGLDYKLKAFFQAASSGFQYAHESWRLLFTNQEVLDLISSDLRNDLMDSIEPIDEGFTFWNDVSTAHYLDQAMYFDIKTWLPNDILFKVDRMSMANSLEVRAPFLDHRVVEFAASLPINMKLNRLKTKYILKELAYKNLGLDYKKNKKLGFNAPTAKWIIKYQNEFLDFLISSKLFEPSFIKRLIGEHVSFKRDNNFRIMALVGLSCWKERVLDGYK